jgi:feruloyl esterase
MSTANLVIRFNQIECGGGHRRCRAVLADFFPWRQPDEPFVPRLPASAVLLCLLAACGGSDDDVIPQLAPATGASLGSCTDLTTRFSFANTTITAADAIAAGTLTVAGTPVGAHCQVTGTMYQRTSTVDAKTYAIGFEMRLPNAWNGRFFYQANGGTDGSVGTASGGIGGGGPLTNALQQGFAVHQLGRRPQQRAEPDLRHRPAGPARLRLPGRRQADADGEGHVQTAYGKAPDRSYIGGCSNGGRHAWSPHRAMPTSTTGSSPATRAGACRSRRRPTSPAIRRT